MTLLNKEDLLQLLETGGPCVSLYLPTHRAGPEIDQDPIRLKNLLSTADERLEAAGVARSERERLLEPGKRRLDDSLFWRHQSDGLALLLAPEKEHLFRLPLAFEELAVVGERFHLKPLLPLLTEGGRFYVLALSRGKVRLFEATPHRISELDLGDTVPKSVADALGYDWEERSLQFHSQRRHAGGRQEAIYHGHGAGSDDRETELRRFLELLDDGLGQALNRTGLPMVLAGVDEITAIFRQVSGYPRLVESSVVGNPDETAADTLQEQAWEVAEPTFREGREQAAQQFTELQGTDRSADDLERIVPAAHDGRIEIAFVPVDRQVWGRYDPGRRTIERCEPPSPGETQLPEDLLDLAATRSLATGATVYAVAADEVPGDGEAAAIFRY